jgi:hypothetical protein
MKNQIYSALIVAFAIGCFGFFMDFQGLKAKVGNIEIKFIHISETLDEIKTEIKLITLEKRAR